MKCEWKYFIVLYSNDCYGDFVENWIEEKTSLELMDYKIEGQHLPVNLQRRYDLMKYANKLTDEELNDLYKLFTDSDATVKELNVTKDDYGIVLEGIVEIPEYEEAFLKENPNTTIEIDDDYEISDFDVKVFHHSGSVTKIYREFMYKKFGNDYAKDCLFR